MENATPVLSGLLHEQQDCSWKGSTTHSKGRVISPDNDSGGSSMNVYALGVASTTFKKWPDRSFRELAGEACRDAIQDAGLADGTELSQIAFGNCAMAAWGQANIRGQVALGHLTRTGYLDPVTPIINVEGGCATGSLALHHCVQAIASGQHDLTMAMGVEKTWIPDNPAKSFALFAGGMDQLHTDEWMSFYKREAARVEQEFSPDPRRIIFLDVHGLQARHHMAQFGTTIEQIAGVAVKNRTHALNNHRAQFRRPTSTSDILNDIPIVSPLTRSMCAPISDGAAAVILCSERYINESASRRARAIRIDACTLSGGQYRGIDEASVIERAAHLAYAEAEVHPGDIDIAEVHDATAFCELLHYESLGFCPRGDGGRYFESGATQKDGALPVNLSGGLISKGHPLAASGLGMIHELVTQLRGEAKERQAPNQPQKALAQNAGGLMGFDEALCGVTILSRHSG
jgi:acetyl-CoA acetyltransferase